MNFYIADTHFNDLKIFQYERFETFSSIEEMNETIIKNWNSVISEKDTVFILGDFGEPNFVNYLNGHKILIKGNHDNYSNEEYRMWGFDEAYDYSIIKNFVFLSHEPMYMNSHIPYINIFGHVHSNPIYQTHSATGHCVCAERLNYTPISEKDLYNLF